MPDRQVPALQRLHNWEASLKSKNGHKLSCHQILKLKSQWFVQDSWEYLRTHRWNKPFPQQRKVYDCRLIRKICSQSSRYHRPKQPCIWRREKVWGWHGLDLERCEPGSRDITYLANLTSASRPCITAACTAWGTQTLIRQWPHRCYKSLQLY